MGHQISNYELARRIRSSGAGIQGQGEFSRRADAVEKSTVDLCKYYHSNGRSLKGVDISGIDYWTTHFLEEELNNGVERTRRRESSCSLLTSRYKLRYK